MQKRRKACPNMITFITNQVLMEVLVLYLEELKGVESVPF